MVLQRRLDYGFNGYQVPATPRGARSARRRAPFKKADRENQMCAFDLLATVAGKLLLERECTPIVSKSTEKDRCTVPNSNEDEQQLKVEHCDQGSYNSLSVDLGSQYHNQKNAVNVNRHNKADVSGLVSVITSDSSEKVGCDENLVLCKDNDDFGRSLGKLEAGSSKCRELGDHKLVDETERRMKAEPLISAKASGDGTHNSEGSKVWKEKPTGPISLDSRVPLHKDHIVCGSFPPCRDDVKVVSRDDDENSSGCSQPSTVSKFLRSPQRLGDRRIRKLLAPKYWNMTPKLKNGDVSYSNRCNFRDRKSCFKRHRSQRNYPFKKRTYFQRCSFSNSDGGNGHEGISHLIEKTCDGHTFHSKPQKHGAIGKSSSVISQNTSFQRKDSYVKLRIKSFRVPELFIEIPETATVGALKRTVMETVSAILGGGLCVGVLLQGKKVRDDNKTLLQTGISHDNQLDALGFSLEPNMPQAPQPVRTGDSSFLLPSDNAQPLTRHSPPSSVNHHGTCTDPAMANLGLSVDSDHDSAPSPTDMSIDKTTTDSRAIVPAQSMSMETLAMVPIHRKPKHSEVTQRRIRRPFSVSEVEALVQAVEKLGTGRWRDVKLRAFDNAKHRTYVDLKDKWKTLVHTARISPQQRRGEPVPQELLDRVLSAHAYWTHQQAKHQLKHQTETLISH